MKIKTQALSLLFFGWSVIFLVGFMTVRQFRAASEISREMQLHQNGLIKLNSFQVSAFDQVLLGVDLIRTGDISGTRIVPYRTAETRFARQVGELDQLAGLGSEFAAPLTMLKIQGENLSRLCKEDLMEPLYSHQPIKEDMIELLIYKELYDMGTRINAIRKLLDEKIALDLEQQNKQLDRFLHNYFPMAMGALFLFLFLSFFIILRTLGHINRTGKYLGDLALGKSRLDAYFPEKGNDEITRLRKNFNLFLHNLNDRHGALKGIARDQVEAGKKLKSLSQDNAAAVTQLDQSLTSVNDNTHAMTDRVESAMGEVRKIAQTMDSLEKMSRDQEIRVGAMAARGERVQLSLSSQQKAVDQQVDLTRQVRDESHRSRSVLELLRKQIEEILEQSSCISQAMTSIQDLADQTDVLAINAAIEAARSGMYGKGFAVISDEMRGLSSQVRQNSELVTGLLDELKKKLFLMADEEKQNKESMERLIVQSDKADRAIVRLKTSSGEISSVLSGFLEFMNEVKSGSSSVHGETEKTRKSSLQIASDIEEMARTQKELTEESDGMVRGIELISRGTDALRGLSVSNSQSVQILSEEIRKMGN